VFWSNWLVGSITTLALILLFWPLIHAGYEHLRSRVVPKSWKTLG
jgi:putative tricarboxylic transport membrane protein